MAKTVSRLAARYSLSTEDTEDLIADCRAEFYEKFRFLGLFNAPAFYRRVAFNQTMELVRRRAQQKQSPISELGAGDWDLEHLLAQREFTEDVAVAVIHRMAASYESDQLTAALERLPDQQRRAIELIRFGGATYREAASVLGLSVGTVKGYVHEATKRLRADLQGEEQADG